MNRVYLIGTDSYKATERIAELMKQPEMLLLDVRLTAWSWRSDFTHIELEGMYGDRYRRIRHLGNTAKPRTNFVRIANPVAGMQGLVRYLNGGHDLVLLYQDEQHISEICRLLVGVRPGIEVIKFASEVSR